MTHRDSPKDRCLPAKIAYRRTIRILLILAAAAALCAGGCGSGTDAGTSSGSASSEEESVTDSASAKTAQDSSSEDGTADPDDSGESGSEDGDTDGSTSGTQTGKKSASSLTYQQKLTYIQNHKNKYPKRYRKLAKQYPETIDFVYNYPELHDAETEIDLSEEAASASIPLLIQWDARWGYASYGDGDMGYTGCGPTCLSMVALYLTGNAKYTPLYIAEYADENGYYSEGSGTLWLLMTKGAKAFGLTASEVDTDEATLKKLVKSGCPVICSVGKGDFTDSGHFIVLTGCKNGKFTLHDPNSVENSEKTWSYKRLAKQIRSAWSYQASGDSEANGAAG